RLAQPLHLLFVHVEHEVFGDSLRTRVGPQGMKRRLFRHGVRGFVHAVTLAGNPQASGLRRHESVISHPYLPPQELMRVRSIFLSDIHLGTPACQAERLLDFLRNYDCERLFLVGDIVDFWHIRQRGVTWTTAQNTVVQKILKRARHDVQVVFVPGNHDEAVREHAGTLFGNIRVERDHVHEAADGKRYLLIHGDEFDKVTQHHRWVAMVGTHAYDWLVELNMWLSWVRRTLRIPGYWSLAGYLKRKVKGAVSFISNFEESLVRYARERGVDGVVCGHIH